MDEFMKGFIVRYVEVRIKEFSSELEEEIYKKFGIRVQLANSFQGVEEV